MPILYYKANTANTLHDRTNPDNPDNIYNYRDNNELVLLGKPFDPPPRRYSSQAYRRDGSYARLEILHEHLE